MNEEILNEEFVEQTSIEQQNEEEKLKVQAELNEAIQAFLYDLAEKHSAEMPSANAVKEKKTQYDSIGKVIQTAEGDGSLENPFKTWKEGMEVHVGEWWLTHDSYLWEAIKDGVPASSTDKEYWDVVGL